MTQFFPKAFEIDVDELLLSAVVNNATLRAEYRQLYKAAIVDKKRTAIINQRVQAISKAKARYENVQAKTKVPWWFIAIVHQLECGGSFSKHLHNGDPLTARTTHVPKGRPAKGNAPFTWEDSAIDALTITGQTKVTDYSLENSLYLLEGYNGYGYRLYHPTVKSPYLWSFTSVYKKGKYVEDGRFDAETVSQQIGAVCFLKALKIF